jgi:hypothetical protein
MEYRLRLEAGRLDEDIEIAALISDSLETLQRTHSRYRGPGARSQLVARIASRRPVTHN